MISIQCTDAVLMYTTSSSNSSRDLPSRSPPPLETLVLYNGNYFSFEECFLLRHTWCISKRFSRGTLTQTDHIWGRPNMSCWNGDAPNIDLFGAMAFTGKNVRQNRPTCHWGKSSSTRRSVRLSDDDGGGSVADPARCSRSRHLLSTERELWNVPTEYTIYTVSIPLKWLAISWMYQNNQHR